MIVMTPQEATQKANDIVARYPSATNVQDALDLAMQDGFFQSNDEAIAVWGRLCRLLPQKVGA
jgi:hypothetical protein